jgi:hypothetical protein
MGHYAGEMHSGRYEREAAEDYKLRLKIAAKIKNDIARRGLEAVLADILLDPQLYKIHVT